MTWPLTFPSLPEDWHRINEDAKGERAIGERENVEVVNLATLEESMSLTADSHR